MNKLEKALNLSQDCYCGVNEILRKSTKLFTKLLCKRTFFKLWFLINLNSYDNLQPCKRFCYVEELKQNEKFNE